MSRFKIGDRVRLTATDRAVPHGSEGTVLEDDDVFPFVAWDNFRGGHDGRVLGVLGPHVKSVWAIFEEDLAPLVASTYLNGHADAIVDTSGKSVALGVSPSTKETTTMKKPDRYVTAWAEGPVLTLTGDGPFAHRSDADHHANALAAEHADTSVAVLKVVSQHSSHVVVTTEAA